MHHINTAVSLYPWDKIQECQWILETADNNKTYIDHGFFFSYTHIPMAKHNL
jgi:hypothetical protein